MIPELNEYQNRRVVNEKITLPLGHKWLSWVEYGEGKRTIPKGAMYFNSYGIWEDDDNAGGWWMNNISIICIPVYPTIPNGYKLVMEGEKIEKGYKYCNISCDGDWGFDRPVNGHVGDTYNPKVWSCCKSVNTFFINPIIFEVKPEITLSDKVRELEAENASLKRDNEKLKADLKARIENPDEGLLDEIRYLRDRLVLANSDMTELRDRRDGLNKELADIKDAWQKLSDFFNKKP